MSKISSSLDAIGGADEYTLKYAHDGWYVYNSCLVSTTAFTNVPVIHASFILELVRALDMGKVTKGQIKALYE